MSCFYLKTKFTDLTLAHIQQTVIPFLSCDSKKKKFTSLRLTYIQLSLSLPLIQQFHEGLPCVILGTRDTKINKPWYQAYRSLWSETDKNEEGITKNMMLKLCLGNIGTWWISGPNRYEGPSFNINNENAA